jgi:hypothetical protein
MKSAETKAFKATLQAMRARLRGDVTTMARRVIELLDTLN